MIVHSPRISGFLLLLPSCFKILDRYVNDWLTAYVGHLIANDHHGSVKRLFTATNILAFINFLDKCRSLGNRFTICFCSNSPFLTFSVIHYMVHFLTLQPFPPRFFRWFHSIQVLFAELVFSFHSPSDLGRACVIFASIKNYLRPLEPQNRLSAEPPISVISWEDFAV